GAEPDLRPRVPAAVLESLAGLVPPVLPPVLRHERALDGAVRVPDEHDEHVLEADEPRLVGGNVHVLRRPRLVRAGRGESRPEADDLEEIEARPVRPGHGEDRAPVALQRREPGLAETSPRLARPGRELDGGSGRRPAARRGGVAVTERPREGELTG